jgi:molybdopterin converting factor small subunit
MLTVNVLLSGRLKLDGFGRGRPIAGDGTVTLALGDGSTIREAIAGLRVPSDRVVMTMVNGRQCPSDAALNSGDPVILIPEDVPGLWRALGRQNLGMGIGFDS